MSAVRKGKRHINFINSRALPEPYCIIRVQSFTSTNTFFINLKFLPVNYRIVLGYVAADPPPFLQISEQAFVKEDRELAEIELGPGIFGIDHCTPYPDFIIACGLVDFTLYNITGIHRNGCPVFLTAQCVIFRGFPCDTDRCSWLLVRKVFHGFLKFRRFHKPV